jgi:hypothetical protein
MKKVCFEKLIVSQIFKEFPVFYRTQRFNTAFTTARQLPLFSTFSHMFLKDVFLILSLICG